MEALELENAAIDRQIARRLKSLRLERGWALDELVARSGISRASLSRIENAEVSPTASVLNRICAAYGMTMSKLMSLVETRHEPLLRRAEQAVWTDPEAGFTRRAVSPPTQGLAGEVVECNLDAATRIAYDGPPKPGLEQHVVLIAGRLAITVDGQRHEMRAGDCLRFKLHGPTAFETPPRSAAHYFIFVV